MYYLTIAVAVFLLPNVCLGQDLQRDAQRLFATKYRDVASSAEKLAQDRRFGEGHEHWLTAVPDDQKTAADYFLLGNVLFQAKPEKALQLHRHAATLDPSSADIQLELAMCLHRAGEFKAAAASYEAYIESPTAKSRGPGVFDALLADCLIRAGKYERACDAWERVPFRSYRIKISKYAHKIHGDASPFQRHYDLLTRARQKDLDAGAQMILLDCEWDWDWWTVEVKRDFLEADSSELGKLFSAADKRLILIQAISAFHLPEEPNVAFFTETLKKNNLIIGDTPELPSHGLLVSHAVRLLLENELSTPENLLGIHEGRFEAELLQPADEIDVEMVNVYASLLAQSGKLEALARTDRLMWQKCKEPRFAASYLMSLIRDEKDLSDKEVQRIAREFPDHRVVSSIALSLAVEENQSLSEPLAVAIAAEFQSLTPNPISGTKTSDRLNALFTALRQSIDKQ